MSDQNQGASIEAERADFEAWAMQAHPEAHALLRGDGEYKHGGMRDWWPCWQAARRTPAAQVGAGELPPPDVIAYTCVGDNDAYSPMLVKRIVADAIEADRAQQAVPDRVLQARDAYISELEQRLADLRAQLAAKGQGLVDQVVGVLMYLDANGELAWRGSGDDEADAWDENEAKAHTAHQVVKAMNARRAAPASAQPADPRLEVFIDWYLREGKRSEIHPNGHVERTTRSHVLAWLDSRAGAQPDQRESAAEITVDWPPCNPACDPAEGIDCRNRHCSCEAAKASVARQLAASPAAQPAKDEQKGDV